METEQAMQTKKAMQRNIFLSYVIASLMWMRFYVPVIALFYIASKVPLEQFTIILAVFSLSILLLEIPTGVIADLLGKKKTLLLSRACYIIEIALVAFCNGFWPFLIAKIISGIGVSLASGTDSAILFDSLKKLNREKEHKKISGAIHTVTNISMGVVFIVGAYLFSINPKLPAYVSLPLISVGFIFTFFFTEPYAPSKKFNMKNSLDHLKQGIKQFWASPYLKYLAFFTLIVGAAIEMMFSMSSQYLSNILIPIVLIGVFSFIGFMLTALLSKQAHSIEEKLGQKKSLFIIQVFLVLSILLMSLMVNQFGVIFYLLIPLISGFYRVITNDYVNHHVESHNRATMLSINNMFDNIGLFILFPVLGYATKAKSMSFSYFWLGIFVLIYLIVLYFVFKKTVSEN